VRRFGRGSQRYREHRAHQGKRRSSARALDRDRARAVSANNASRPKPAATTASGFEVPQPVLRLDRSSGDDRGVVNAVSRIVLAWIEYGRPKRQASLRST